MTSVENNTGLVIKLENPTDGPPELGIEILTLHETPRESIEVSEEAVVLDALTTESSGWQAVTALQREDEYSDAAFESLWDSHYEGLRRFAFSRTGKPDLAEDIAQTTFMRFYEKRSTFAQRDSATVGALLTVIARNLIKDYNKLSANRLTEPTADITDSDVLFADSAELPEDATIEAYESEAVLDAIDQLPPEQQRCIFLRFYRGYKFTDTADILNKTPGATKQLQSRALRALRRILVAQKFER